MARYNVSAEPDAAVLAANYKLVKENIEAASGGRQVQLVAVSKTKSPACVKHLYDLGHLDFGENYVQELCEKASVLPSDIRWRMIGHLQSNKVKELLSGVPQLALIESVDSESLARKLNSGCETYRKGNPLDVFVQVNTSDEESKSGVHAGPPTVALAKLIAQECPLLRLKGLMTIGMPDYTSRPENFTCLVQCREDVAAALGIPADSLHLSMGMSGDYINAVKMGSTNVRVGTTIFGPRYYASKSEA